MNPEFLLTFRHQLGRVEIFNEFNQRFQIWYFCVEGEFIEGQSKSLREPANYRQLIKIECCGWTIALLFWNVLQHNIFWYCPKIKSQLILIRMLRFIKNSFYKYDLEEIKPLVVWSQKGLNTPVLVKQRRMVPDKYLLDIG